jgi:hypothetical protein
MGQSFRKFDGNAAQQESIFGQIHDPAAAPAQFFE